MGAFSGLWRWGGSRGCVVMDGRGGRRGGRACGGGQKKNGLKPAGSSGRLGLQKNVVHAPLWKCWLAVRVASVAGVRSSGSKAGAFVANFRDRKSPPPPPLPGGVSEATPGSKQSPRALP
jgi:hypothetical protein